MGFDLEALREAVKTHGKVTRVVIAATTGSSPREVGAAMHAAVPEDRVPAHAVARADPGPVDRGAHQGPAHALTAAPRVAPRGLARMSHRFAR